MGKIKTHRASAKRFKATGTGKLKMYHPGIMAPAIRASHAPDV